jgi:enamine deaminase RidA (YjgF/YER057c/UK114 family)
MTTVDLKPVEEQVVALMGASSGIGREAALRFAKRGAKVVVSARGEEGLDSLVEEIRREGGEAMAVVASGSRLVTTAGAVPLDAEGNLVGAGDLHTQARQTLQNLAIALEAVGATGHDVIKMTVYVVAGERTDLGVVWGAVQESGIAGAASTLLGVSMLAIEGQLVEFEAIAVLD